MKIVMITENDPAGMGIAFSKAINTFSDHTCRLITTTTRYNFEFEKDIHVPDLNEEDWEEVDDILRQSDIFHFHILADEYLPLGPLKIFDYLQGKRILHHHHGHPDFRNNPGKYSDKYKRLGRKAVVSTPDLLRLMPEAIWQPNLVPIDDPDYQPLDIDAGRPVRIGHSPTRKDLKNTDDLLRVVRVLREDLEFRSLELDIIENCRHRECLRRKNDCHIIFDHMQGYYGVSSLESLSQGKVVVAGLDSWNIEHIMSFTEITDLPWLIPQNAAELETNLKDLHQDVDMRRVTSLNSRIFMEQHWSDKIVVERLVRLYEKL